jgi:predicted negative regulator of RcsB-dependent stress response
VWDTRGHIHAALGNRDAAISDFRAALAIDPNSTDSRAGLAKLGVN